MRVHRGNIQGEYKPADPREQADRQVGKHRAKKDTKRWCLGHPGREHEPRWEIEERWHRGQRGYPAGRELRCANCRGLTLAVASRGPRAADKDWKITDK